MAVVTESDEASDITARIGPAEDHTLGALVLHHTSVEDVRRLTVVGAGAAKAFELVGATPHLEDHHPVLDEGVSSEFEGQTTFFVVRCGHDVSASLQIPIPVSNDEMAPDDDHGRGLSQAAWSTAGRSIRWGGAR